MLISEREPNPTAGHTSPEDRKAAPADAVPQAVPKPIRAKHHMHYTRGSRDV